MKKPGPGLHIKTKGKKTVTEVTQPRGSEKTPATAPAAAAKKEGDK